MVTPPNALPALKPIHLPPPISMWPLAYGWWLLLVSFAIGVALLSFIAYRHYRLRKPKRRALKSLAHIKTHFTDPAAIVMALSKLLRQVALAYYPRADVAGLTGRSWLQFLDRAGDTHEFTQGVGQHFVKAPYQAQFKGEHALLMELVEKWIKHV